MEVWGSRGGASSNLVGLSCQPVESDAAPSSVRTELNSRTPTWCLLRTEELGGMENPYTFGVRSVVSNETGFLELSSNNAMSHSIIYSVRWRFRRKKELAFQRSNA